MSLPVLDSEADITQAYVKRILEVNETLHMVTEINPDAWSIAKELDNERARGQCRGSVNSVRTLLLGTNQDVAHFTASQYSSKTTLLLPIK